MRKGIVSELVTLDGVREPPEKWECLFWKDEAAQFPSDELFVSDALGLGRVTYQAFAAWPSMPDGEGLSDRLNGLSQYVVSNTLQREALSRRLRVGRVNKGNNCSVILNAALDETRGRPSGERRRVQISKEGGGRWVSRP